MNRKNAGWIDADQLIQQSHPDEILHHYGIPLPEKSKGNNYRLGCPMADCDADSSSYGKFSIELAVPYRIHCFACGVRGNLFDLVWIAKHGTRPDGGKLRGEQFKEAIQDLKSITVGVREKVDAVVDRNTGISDPSADDSSRNIPLHRSENERTRDLVHLWREGITDPAEMSPAASRYWRQREFFNELCDKWGISWLPGNAKGTLRGRIIYRIDNVAGEPLAYAGRDPDYDAKQATWLRKKKGSEPIKTRFPSEKFFRKGLEFYGQQARRLQEPGYREAIKETGIVVVEGFNDVLALDQKRQPSLGAMSNRVTESQIEKLVRFAKQLTGKVTFLFDRNEAGQEGQREAIARVSQHIPVLNGWIGYGGTAMEPENLSDDEWTEQKERIAAAWRAAR